MSETLVHRSGVECSVVFESDYSCVGVLLYYGSVFIQDETELLCSIEIIAT